MTLILEEYGKFVSRSFAAASLDLSVARFDQLFNRATELAAIALGVSSVIEYGPRSSFRFAGVAGILNLSPRASIEIAPKFLPPADDDWREDFLWIAAFTRFGQLFREHQLPTQKKSVNLYEIIAQSWLLMFEANQRSLLRSYVHTTWLDFNLDGDPDDEDMLQPRQDGIRQEGLKLSRANPHNTLLLRASEHLRKQATGPETLLRLDRANEVLAAATREKTSHRPPRRTLFREREWDSLLELSRLILGFSRLGYAAASGPAFLPGYLLRTNEAWERLLLSAAKRAFPEADVAKKTYPLGHRVSPMQIAKLAATPDISIRPVIHGNPFVADAKYKTVASSPAESQPKTTVSTGDIYESLAFMKAAGVKHLVLLYPGIHTIKAHPEDGQPIETIQIDDAIITACSLAVAGISKPMGFSQFCHNLRRVLELARDRTLASRVISTHRVAFS